MGLRGSPPSSSPREAWFCRGRTEFPLPCYRIAEAYDGLGGVSQKIRATKERFLIVFRETTYTMLENLGIKAT